MSRYVTLDDGDVRLINDTRALVEERIGKAGPVAEMVWRDVLNAFENKLQETQRAAGARNDVLGYLKKAENEEVEEMLKQEFEQLNEQIGVAEDGLVDMATELNRAATADGEFDEEVHGFLRQFPAARLQEMQQERQRQYAAQMQQRIGGMQ